MRDDIKVTGVVQYTAPIGEYDKRLVLLTRERGKITVFAGGCRKPTSILLAACRPFVFAEFTLHEGRSSYRLQSAKISEHFDEISKDFDAVTYGSYFLELAGYFSEENVESSQMISLLYVSLKALLKPALPKKLVRMIFEVRVLCINGEAPEVFHCIKCGSDLEEGFFQIKGHGIICKECAGEGKKEKALSKAAVYALQYMEAVPLNKLYTFILDEEIFGELLNCINRYYQYYVGHTFQSLAMLTE